MTTTALEVIQNSEVSFNKVSSTPDVKWQAESQFALQSLQKNQFLSDTASRNITSLENAIINVAAIGISLNPALKHAYLVPRDKAVCLDISYMGLIHLAKQSGEITSVDARIVYAKDKYVNKGVSKEPLHESHTFGDRGDMLGVYCVATKADGTFQTEEMTMEEINQVRNTSKAKDSSYSPWKTFFKEMARKTVVKRASKYWTLGERMATAIDVINQHEGLSDDNTAQPQERVINEVAELPLYPEEKFNANFSEWQNLILNEGKAAQTVVNMIESRFTLTVDMKKAILHIGEK